MSSLASKRPPFPAEVHYLHRLVEPYITAIHHCIEVALEGGDPQGVDYDWETDQLIFRVLITDVIRDVCPVALGGVEEIWIVGKSGRNFGPS